MRVEFFGDGRAFLESAEPFLAAHPVECNVLASTADRDVRLKALTDRPSWFAAISDEDGVVGAAMRTHPDPPHAGFTPYLPIDARAPLLAALAERGERVPAWSGDLDTAKTLCEGVAVGRPVVVNVHTRLFEATRLKLPHQPAGALRVAQRADEDVVIEACLGFHHDSELQGGRLPDPHWSPQGDALRARLEAGAFWLWEVNGEPVHLTGIQPPVFGVQRIAPVYTPAHHRGRGYASWVVANLTKQSLGGGYRPCLSTDQANPVSNAIYERIGYRCVRDEGCLIIEQS